MAVSIVENITRDEYHVHAGEDRIIRFTDADGSDMSAWTLRFEIFNQRTSNSILVKTSGSGITTENANETNDRAVATIAAADWANLAKGRYDYEFARTDSGNKVVLAKGFIQIEEGRF